jgi:uncharacterized protein YaaW (UPF0174 family)
MITRKLFVLVLISIFFTNNIIYAEYTFEECNKIQKDSLRDELNRKSQQVFSSESSNIDIKQIINSKWSTIGMDSTIDREVDNAIARIGNESGMVEKAWSSFSSNKAKEFAEKAGNYVFGSERFNTNLDRLSTEISDELSNRLENISAQSASSSLMCLEEFIGQSYSDTISRIFEEAVKKETQAIKWDNKIDSNQPSMVTMHQKALGGLGVIIASQIGKKIAQKIGQSIAKRIAGRIASRIAGRIAGRAVLSSIPVVGWIIGAGMIGWDVYNSSEGALPQIQKDLKGEEVKEKIRSEISLAVTEQLATELPQMAREIANDIFSLWSDFKNKFRNVLELSESNSEFKYILDNTSKDNFYKLSNLVNLISNKLDKDQLIDAINNRTFENIMNLPETSFIILETSKSIKTLIEWSELAGLRIDKVVEFEIYKQKTPADFDKQLLEKLIEVNDT